MSFHAVFIQTIVFFMNRLAIIIIILALIGCASNKFIEVAPDEIKCHGTDPLYYTVYVGSDEIYHYFLWSEGLYSGKWKVRRKNLYLSKTFKHDGTKSVFAVKGGSSGITLIELKKVETE